MTVVRAALAAVQLRILRFYKQENSEMPAWHSYKAIIKISVSQNPLF